MNAYHFLEDVTNTFVSLILFDEDPNQVEIAIYDGMDGIVNNPLFTFWSELFPKGVRIIRNDPFPRNTCFARSITNMYGMRSHFTEFGGYKTDTYCSSPILKGFRSWAIEKLQIDGTVPVKRLTLLFISRRQYLSSRSITRVLVNEDVILETIKTRFPSLNVVVFRPETYKTFKEQTVIAVQGNILVGVHGAGLVYSMFMTPGSHLIEIFMDDRNSMNRHYHNIAMWMGLQYHSIDFHGKVIPPEQIVNVIDIAVKDLIKMSTTAYTHG
ncbi:beta-1,2-xylosyltransferase RCN11-like [Bradysia coprophila]|uniref:beta-1,2-xylosyltransferase RCN11-like n=1 Tax=Bradysia coprophila TaxID=38358 RepID=UPI00187DBBBF|nr:beta-1,2-xylosyltransferase RCN11-like [Bradysia coprophila]